MNKQRKEKIKTSEDKHIYGVVDYKDNNNDKLIIFIHGFTGSKNQHQYIEASKFFNEKSFSTFRFNLYGKEADARKTSEVSFTNHVEDTNIVINYFKDKYKQIYLVGHSLGGPVAAFADQTNVTGIVLWDPTTGFDSAKEKGMYFVDALDAYLCDYRMQTLFGKKLIEEWMGITVPKQISSINIPVKIIFAGNYTKYDDWKAFLDTFKVDSSYSIIEGAAHDFIEPGIVTKLYEETLDWIK